MRIDMKTKTTSNFPKFLLLWTGSLISSVGGGLTSFGLGVYVFQQTGSAAGMALVTLLAFLPTLLLSVPAGVLADRYDRRVLMMIGDGFSAFGILYILICMLRGQADLTQICVGVFVSAVFSSLLEPSYRATVTDLLTREEYSKASGLVSLLVFLISAVCIRFVLLTRVEKEKREIGMMKALGMDRREVRKIYFAKYALLAGVGAAVGTIAAWCVYPALSGKMQELYGEGPGVLQSFLFSLLGAALVTGCMLFFVYRVLRKIERITALDALLGREGRQRGGLQRYLAVIAAVCTFLMVIPANLYHTMASPSFVTYMGIGNGELRIDIRQGEQKLQTTQKLLEKLGEDARVERFALLQTSMQRVQAASGSENLLVESGDHTLFPVSYHEGRASEQTDEIALSVLEAKELGAQIGDTLRVEMDGKTKEYRVCGLYSDITNGGKTAKASAGQEQVEEEKLMWNIIYLSLKDGVDRMQWAQEFREIAVELAGDDPTQAAVKVVSIREYVQATYGQTLGQIRMAAVVTDVAALGILLLVTMLFLRLLLEKKRYDLSLQKALGFGSRDLAGSYFRMGMIQTALGAAAGILLGNLLGEKLCGMALQSFGADGFRFACDWMQILLVIPAFSLTTAGFEKFE